MIWWINTVKLDQNVAQHYNVSSKLFLLSDDSKFAEICPRGPIAHMSESFVTEPVATQLYVSVGHHGAIWHTFC